MPSICIDVAAAPGIRESNVRRRVLPRVYPNPGSSGSTKKVERVALKCCSSMWGRWTINTAGPSLLLGVELDDELLLDCSIDVGTVRQRGHGDLAFGRVYGQPFGNHLTMSVDGVLNRDQVSAALFEDDDE